MQALARPHPGACVKGGIRTRIFHWCEVSEIFTTSVWLSRMTRQTSTIKLSRRSERAAFANPYKVRSAIGIRLDASFPPTGPALLGTRLSGASPGIRVSRSGLRRDIFE